MSNRADIIEKAYKTYPILRRTDDDGMPYDAHADLQQGFIIGYEKAEKNIRKIVEKYRKSGAKCMQQSADANEQGEYTYWDGFNDCAIAILRELENN